MKNKKEVQKYFKDNYNNKDNNYKVILSEIMEEENTIKNTNCFFNFFKIATSTVIALLGTTSIVFASVKIYNEYVKKQEELHSQELYVTEEGLYSNDFTKDMMYEESIDLYYKIITNIDDYNKYKNIINELPDMLETDFENNFLILIGNWGARYPHESDLMISEVNADEKTTYITMKQKENSDYDKSSITLYAIIDKETLKENVKLNIENSNISAEKFVSIESLSNNYSIEDALKDGCFVEENTKVLSENKYAIDELIENSKNETESFIRIYSKNNNVIRIIDLQYKNGMFMSNVRTLENSDVYTFSFKYLTKQEHSQSNTYEYGYNSVDRSIDAGFLIEISYE